MFIIREYLLAWIFAGLSLVLLVAATILNAMFAFSLDTSMFGIQLLAFVAFALNLLAIGGLIFITLQYIPKLKRGAIGWSNALFWRFFGICVSVAMISSSVGGTTLVWAVVRRADLPERMAEQPSETIVTTWLTIWGVCTLLQIGEYSFIGWWTKRVLCSRSLAAIDVDFGVGSPEMRQPAIQPRTTSNSFGSQDPTLASPPQTPTTIGMSSPLKLSQSLGKVRPTSSRTRLMHAISFTRDSENFAFDYPTGESMTVPHSFDDWDTSDHVGDARTTLRSTPLTTRTGLETIPGSRPESPAKALDGPFLPNSPHATSPNIPIAIPNYETPSSPKPSISSPPSSPPNFSRPTSRQVNRPTTSPALDQPAWGAPLENLIHPLFRSTSPHPAPVATAGSMVTASPLAGQSITPKTLTRMRSASLPQLRSPLAESEVPPTPQQDYYLGDTGPGSPGPSIIDDDDELLPPVIPGFVLSAGQRSSLLGYGKRRSVKSRPASFHSQENRLGMME